MNNETNLNNIPKSFYPFWFDKSYLKMKLIKGVKVNV